MTDKTNANAELAREILDTHKERHPERLAQELGAAMARLHELEGTALQATVEAFFTGLSSREVFPEIDQSGSWHELAKILESFSELRASFTRVPGAMSDLATIYAHGRNVSSSEQPLQSARVLGPLLLQTLERLEGPQGTISDIAIPPAKRAALQLIVRTAADRVAPLVDAGQPDGDATWRRFCGLLQLHLAELHAAD